MLNITRKVGEKIIIGEDIILEVMEVSGSSVRIGINAPRAVPVYREEIWESVRAENAAAARTTPTKLPETPANDGKSGRPGVRQSPKPGTTKLGGPGQGGPQTPRKTSASVNSSQDSPNS